MAQVGRPSLYNKRLADQICDQLAAGRALVDICSAKDMPNPSTIYDWLKIHHEFAESYTHARETAGELRAAEILEIADTPMVGETRVFKADGSVEIREGDMIEHRRLMIDARKWTAAKLKPKVYGEKHALELSGTVNFAAMGDEDLLTELLELVATGVVKLPEGVSIEAAPQDQPEADDWSEFA
jgi:hypothetical protein